MVNTKESRLFNNETFDRVFLKFMERVGFQIEKKQDLNFDNFLSEFKKSEKSGEN